MNKTTPQIYRDCLRLIKHAFGRSKKAEVSTELLAAEFRRHANETNPEKIAELQNRAKQGLMNYLAIDSLSKMRLDPKASVAGRTAPSSLADRLKPRAPKPKKISPGFVTPASDLPEPMLVSDADADAPGEEKAAPVDTAQGEADAKPATKRGRKKAAAKAEGEAADAKPKKRGRPKKADSAAAASSQ